MPKTNIISIVKAYTDLIAFLYQRLKGIIACVICIFLILFLNSNNKFAEISKNKIVDNIRSFFYVFSKPITSATESIGGLHSYFVNQGDYNRLYQENSSLKGKILESEIKLNDLENLKLAAAFKESSNYKFVLSTRLISNSYDLSDMSYIPVGTDSGVQTDDILINQYGLIGKVIKPFYKTSNVMLVTDNNSQIPALMLPERQKCIVSGYGSHTNLLKVSFLPPNFIFHNGQTIVTSGEGKIFPYGLALAAIKVQADEYYVKALGLSNSSEFVQLLKKDRP